MINQDKAKRDDAVHSARSSSRAFSVQELPEDCFCPISREPLIDPVFLDCAACRMVCGRDSAQRWLDEGHDSCPLCSTRPLRSRRLYPIAPLGGLIRQLISNRSELSTSSSRSSELPELSVTSNALSSPLAVSFMASTFQGHSAVISCCAVYSNNTRIVSGDIQGVVKIWDAVTSRCIRTIQCNEHCVRCLAVFGNDSIFVTNGNCNNKLTLRGAAIGNEIRTLSGHSESVTCCAISRNGLKIVSGSWDKTIKLWDMATGRELQTLSGHSNFVNCCAITDDGTKIVSGDGWNNALKLWDATTGNQISTLLGHSGIITCCAFFDEGKKIISGSMDKTLTVWDVETGRNIRTLYGHNSFIICCAVSVDGTKIVSGSHDQKLKLWDAATGHEIWTLSGHTSAVKCCAFFDDGTKIVSGSNDGTLIVWNVRR